jgi:hypothetical protein
LALKSIEMHDEEADFEYGAESLALDILCHLLAGEADNYIAAVSSLTDEQREPLVAYGQESSAADEQQKQPSPTEAQPPDLTRIGPRQDACAAPDAGEASSSDRT